MNLLPINPLQKMADSITHGAVFQLTGFENKELTREDFKTYFNDYAKVAWVDYDKGDSKVNKITPCTIR